MAEHMLEVSLCHAQSFGRSVGIMQNAYEAGIFIGQGEELGMGSCMCNWSLQTQKHDDIQPHLIASHGDRNIIGGRDD